MRGPQLRKFFAHQADELTDGGATALHSHAGGGGVSTLTHTVTTDADTFFVNYTFDLQCARPVYVKTTVLAFDVDGEVAGSDPGQVGVDTIWRTSQDGITQCGSIVGGSLQGWAPIGYVRNTISTTVADVIDFGGTALRYLTVQVFVATPENGELYAGANNPTAQVRIDVEYL